MQDAKPLGSGLAARLGQTAGSGRSRDVRAMAGSVETVIDEPDGVAFDRIVADFADCSFDQTWAYSDSQWPGRAERCLVLRDGAPLGGAVVVLLTVPLLGKGLAYVKFGPFWRKAGRPADFADYEAVVRAMADHYCVVQGHHLTILPRPNPEFLAGETAVLDRLGFRVGERIADKNRYLVNVAVCPDEIRASLSQSWRSNLRKALTGDIATERVDSRTAMADFAAMHRQMVDRKGLGDIDSLELLPRLLDELPPAIAPYFHIARHKGRPVAGAVVGNLGDTACYLFGSSTDEALPLRAGYALQWSVAEALAGRPDILWYDLGGEVMSAGLRQFKSGFVGRSGAIVEMSGEYDCWRPGAGHVAARALFALRAAKAVLGRH